MTDARMPNETAACGKIVRIEDGNAIPDRNGGYYVSVVDRPNADGVCRVKCFEMRPDCKPRANDPDFIWMR